MVVMSQNLRTKLKETETADSFEEIIFHVWSKTIAGCLHFPFWIKTAYRSYRPVGLCRTLFVHTVSI